MYLKNILIKNYKSIQNAQIDFEPGLNIIIGKNGAGKSNLLEYIQQYVTCISNSDSISDFSNNIFEHKFQINYQEDDSNFEIEVLFKKESAKFNNKNVIISTTKFSKWKDGSNIYTNTNIFEEDKFGFSDLDKPTEVTVKDVKIIKSLSKIYIEYNLPDKSLWLDFSYMIQITTEFGLQVNKSSNKYHIFNVLENIITDNFLNTGNIDFDNFKEFLLSSFSDFLNKCEINYYLSILTPIAEIRLSPNINVFKIESKNFIENLHIEFLINGNWIPYNYLSDGTKRLFYLITECLSIENGLLLIEEPELGIHPHQLFILMSFLKEQSRYKQIIISTHSPIVLDVLSTSELNRINIAKMTPNGTEFFKLDEVQRAKATEYIEEIGELSYYWLHSDLEND